MISRGFQFLLLGIALSALATAITVVKLDNTRLRKQLAAAQRQQSAVLDQRDENNRLRTLVAQAKIDERAAAKAVRARVLQLREELDRLEKHAASTHALGRQKAAQDAAALANNRDLRVGLVRLEHLTDAGRATPAAALQTLLWAALKGDDAQLASVISLSRTTREQASALLVNLPAQVRSTWTPEKLGALFFTGFCTEMTGAAINNVTISDANHATIAVRFTNGSKEVVLPLSVETGDGGWQVMLPEKAIDAIQRRLQATEKNSPK
jgi:hypothetical protein